MSAWDRIDDELVFFIEDVDERVDAHIVDFRVIYSFQFEGSAMETEVMVLGFMGHRMVGVGACTGRLKAMVKVCMAKPRDQTVSACMGQPMVRVCMAKLIVQMVSECTGKPMVPMELVYLPRAAAPQAWL